MQTNKTTRPSALWLMLLWLGVLIVSVWSATPLNPRGSLVTAVPVGVFALAGVLLNLRRLLLLRGLNRSKQLSKHTESQND